MPNTSQYCKVEGSAEAYGVQVVVVFCSSLCLGLGSIAECYICEACVLLAIFQKLNGAMLCLVYLLFGYISLLIMYFWHWL